MIKRALISVYDKRNLLPLLDTLNNLNASIISSGGTANTIKKLGYNVIEVSAFTGYPEMPGGLVKTLHPKIHGGILGDLNDPEQVKYMKNHGINAIDLVVVNFYPFKEAVKSGVNLKDAAEYIDIGGPALVRAAAKASLLNRRVTVVTDPSQYVLVIKELNKYGDVDIKLKERFALDAFKRTAEYDTEISSYLSKRLEGEKG